MHALKQFFDLYGKFIYFSANSICKSSVISEEVVNDVLYKIWQLSSKTKLEIDNPEGWLYKISINEAQKKIEKPTLPLNENIIDSKNRVDTILEVDSFRSYIANLTDEEQFIFIARFVQDMKFEDIAAALEMPLSSLTTKYYRALKKIKIKIEKS